MEWILLSKAMGNCGEGLSVMETIEGRDILLLTRDEDMKNVLGSILTAPEYSLAAVEEREKIESAVKERHSRVIVIDGETPGVDVPHLLNDMHRGHIRIPVIVISSDSSLDFAKKIREEASS
jgi:DNA-binding NtrC family response regulator